MGHPEVQEAAVVAEPHQRLGEVPVAFLVIRPGHGTTSETLDSYCRERLAKNFKTPRRFIFVDDMPRSNAVNRVSKARLREMLAKGEL
jgi:acyl-coenzyme A synthetase/AMP-(fatty) acid ligase